MNMKKLVASVVREVSKNNDINGYIIIIMIIIILFLIVYTIRNNRTWHYFTQMILLDCKFYYLYLLVQKYILIEFCVLKLAIL